MFAISHVVARGDNTHWMYVRAPYTAAERENVLAFAARRRWEHVKELPLLQVPGFTDPGPQATRAIVVRFASAERQGSRGVSLLNATAAWGPFWQGSSGRGPNSATAALAHIAEEGGIDPTHLEIIEIHGRISMEIINAAV